MLPSFTDEQLELQRTVRRLLADVRDGDAPSHLRTMLGLGAADIEGETERGLMFEEAGYACAGGPIVTVLGGSLPVLDALCPSSSLRAAAGAGDIVPIVAFDGELVVDADLATHFLVRVGDEVGVVPAADCHVEVVQSLDLGRGLGTVTPLAQPEALGRFDTARRVLVSRGLVAVAHELAGVARACVDIAVEHARTRVQFGRPIGTYQAISHQCVDMFIAQENARNHAYYAAWAVASQAADAELAVRRAHVIAAEGAVFCAQRAIQVLGGIGFTWEHRAHRYLRRAHSSASLYATARESRRTVSSLIGLGDDAVPEGA